MSFASPEKLSGLLGLVPGSVSPFGLINDREHTVTVVVQATLMRHELVGFHPNTNTATVVIGTGDFRRFLAWTGNTVKELDF